MTMDTSPIIDFYPVNFKTDLNGKQQDWEAVVLIPFIEEVRVSVPHYSGLSILQKPNRVCVLSFLTRLLHTKYTNGLSLLEDKLATVIVFYV